MDRFASMQAYVKVVELGSFSAAARHLGLSPAMVTRHVGQIEEQLGARLLNRSTRHLAVTDAGQGYFERCLSIIAALDEAEAEAGKAMQSARGMLRITAPAEFGNAHLSSIAARFLECHPAVELYLDFSNRQVDLVQEGYDLAVRVARNLDSSLIGRRLARSRFRAVASPDYLARHPAPASPADLAGHVCLAFGMPTPWTLWQFSSGDRTEDIRVHPRILSTSAEALLQSARLGLGIAALPTFICGEALREGWLMPVLEDYDMGALSVHVLYPHRRLLPARTRLFVDFLVKALGGNGDDDPWEK